jgi:hypothetical protein
MNIKHVDTKPHWFDAVKMLRRAANDMKLAAHFANYNETENRHVQEHLRNAQTNINAALARFQSDIVDRSAEVDKR